MLRNSNALPALAHARIRRGKRRSIYRRRLWRKNRVTHRGEPARLDVCVVRVIVGVPQLPPRIPSRASRWGAQVVRDSDKKPFASSASTARVTLREAYAASTTATCWNESLATADALAHRRADAHRACAITSIRKGLRPVRSMRRRRRRAGCHAANAQRPAPRQPVRRRSPIRSTAVASRPPPQWCPRRANPT